MNIVLDRFRYIVSYLKSMISCCDWSEFIIKRLNLAACSACSQPPPTILQPEVWIRFWIQINSGKLTLYHQEKLRILLGLNVRMHQSQTVSLSPAKLMKIHASTISILFEFNEVLSKCNQIIFWLKILYRV